MAQLSLGFCKTLNRNEHPNSQICIYVTPSPCVSPRVPSCLHLLCVKSHRICHVKLQRIIKSVSVFRRMQGFRLCFHYVSQSCYFTVPGRCLKFVHLKKNVMTGSTNLEIYCLRLCLMPRSQKLKNRFSWDI